MAIDKAGNQPIRNVGSPPIQPPTEVTKKGSTAKSKGTPSAADKYTQAANTLGTKFGLSDKLTKFLGEETTKRNEGGTTTGTSEIGVG